MKQRTNNFSFVLFPVAILVVSFVCSFLTYTYNLAFALWLGVIASFVLTVVGILVSGREVSWLLIVMAFAISMRIPSFFQTYPWGFAYPMADSGLDLTLTNLIQESGKWVPGMGFNVIIGYSYYPILHIFTAMTSTVTGIETTTLARIFPFIVGPLVSVFFYLALRKVLSKEVAIWAALIFNLNGYWHFWEFFVREFMAMIFFSMVIYFVFSMYKIRERRNEFFVLGILAAFMAIASHAWTSYNLLLILAVLAISPALYGRVHSWLVKFRTRREYKFSSAQKRLVLSSFLAVVSILTLSWMLNIAYNLFIVHEHQLLDILTNLLSPNPSFVVHSVQGFGQSSRFLLYFGYAILGLIGVIEIAGRFFSREKTYDDYIFESWFVFSAAYLIAATFLLPSGSGWWVVSWRSWSFAFFGLAPLIGLMLARKTGGVKSSRFKVPKKLKLVLPFLLIFPLISAVLTAPPEILDPNYPRIDDSFYQTALWVKTYLPNSTFALDPYSHTVIVPYGRADTYTSLSWPGGETTFLQTVYQFGNETGPGSLSWGLIAFNKRIPEWIPGASNDSSLLDEQYNKIYDSKSLSIYSLPPDA